MARLSGIQKDVIHLYRACLREAGRKPIENRNNFRQFARDEFRRYIEVDRKDFATIEYLLRKGKRQLETYQSDGIRNVHQ
ncbi:hypothetical protein BT63DRAFT_425318 [Microthyrium microscopicum]|uniref:Complex 1 LYR protein domain-containing protein n=1 Tax=Microthyrium microscopicum TaxID=703497 RepID=A0A6A6UDJ6_9PEZI|nr:hypothetical protein BT63DRAFT_425318 [Microthyrium microscopicum]